MTSVARLQHISSRSGIIDQPRELPRTMSVKSTRYTGMKKNKINQSSAATRAFITQDESVQGFFEETAIATPVEDTRDKMELAFRTINDKRVKGVLGRLDSTIHKLNDAWKDCQETFDKTTDSFKTRNLKTAGNTFALTEIGLDGTNSSFKFSNFLNMTSSEFLSPNITSKMSKIAQSLDLDPRSNEIRDFLWTKINQGRDYYNTIKDEIRKKEQKLVQLNEQSETLDVLTEAADQKNQIVVLEEKIELAELEIETTEMQKEGLNSMIFNRKEDIDLYRKRFTLKAIPLIKVHQELDKNVDYFITLDKIFQHYMQEMGLMKKSSKKNRKLIKRIKHNQEVEKIKELRFEGNIEIEKAYQKKKKSFIIKAKKELEVEKEKEQERIEQLEKDKLSGLYELKAEFEANFDLLTTVSKNYSDKEEYVAHLDNLRNNNEELEFKVNNMCEEINLKKNIDLPTLQAELNDLKLARDPSMSFAEAAGLKKELTNKNRLNEAVERNIVSKQKLLTDLTRGVMTVFNKVSIVKDYLNLEKLDEIKLKQENLGDVLVFCGEVLEILNKNHEEPEAVRSQPMSARSLSSDD